MTPILCHSGRDYNHDSIAVIGASGKIGSIIAARIPEENLTRCGRSSDLQEVIKKAGVIFIAVKPKDLEAVSSALKGVDLSGKTVISFLAGKSRATLQEAFPGATIIRTMPNTALRINKGVLGVVNTDPSNQKLVETFFEGAGQISFIEETQMDAFTALVGSGPAYVFAFFQGMVEGKVENPLLLFKETTALLKEGRVPSSPSPAVQHLISFFNGMVQGGIDVKFSPEESRAYVLSVFEGAAALLEEGGEAPVLMKNIMTPNGTTEAGYNVLGRELFQKSIAEAINSSGDDTPDADETAKPTKVDFLEIVPKAIVAACKKSFKMSNPDQV